MSSEAKALLAFAVAVVVVTLVTPAIGRFARRAGILDHPGGYKQHARPTPYLGGIAILLGLLACLPLAGGDSPIPAIAAGALLICLLGTFDDYHPLPKSLRVAAQAAVAVGVWALGAGWETALPQWADLLLTIAWVVAVTNAFNIFDNLDGAAASVAAGSALGVVGIAAFAGGSWAPAILAAGLLGGCVAFLRHNLARPARIFLGDGGANLLGFVIAASAMTALGGRSSVTVYLAAALLVAVPLLDMALVSVSRSRRGISVLAGGRDHLTHRAQVHLGTPARVSAAVFAAQALLCALSVVCLQIAPAAVIVAATTVFAVIAVIVALEAKFEFTTFSPSGLQSARRVG